MNTNKPKTTKSRSVIPDYLMFVIGILLVLSSNFSDLSQKKANNTDALGLKIPNESLKSYITTKSLNRQLPVTRQLPLD